MSFASNISATTKAATGNAVDGRARLAGVYFVSTGTAGSITLRTGGASGPVLLQLASPAAALTTDLMIPDNGILFEDGVHVTLSGVSSLTVLHVGGVTAA
jgi:hypothetical protein